MSTSPTDPGTPAPRRRARRWWVVALVALVVLVGAGVVAWELEERAWSDAVVAYDAEVARVTAEAEESGAQAEAAYTTSLDALSAAIAAGEPVDERSEGQVADPAVRDSLEVALDDARTLVATEVTYPTRTRTVDALDRTNPVRPGSRPAVVVEIVDGSVPAPADLDAATAALVEATAVVEQAHRQWAYDALGPATTEAGDAVTDLADAGAPTSSLAALDDDVARARTILEDGVDAVDPAEAVPLAETLLDTTEALWSEQLDRVVDARRAAARADGVDCAVDRCVALTFDDGPVADTERLLRVLERRNAPATFFVLGSNVERRPETVRAAARAGHLIANHSWDHPQLTTLDDAAVREQVRGTSDAVEEATGTRPFLLRPPYGDVDDRVRSIATRSGLQTVLWSVDSDDWRTRDADRVHDDVLAAVRDGSNVLLHDIHPTTVDAVGKIIRDLRKEDYVLVTVDLLT